MIKSVWDWICGYNECNIQRIAAIWRDIYIIERSIRTLEERNADTYQEDLSNARHLLSRLRAELRTYRPEDVERGKKAA